MTLPILQTSRLRIRPLAAADHLPLFYLINADPLVRRYVSNITDLAGAKVMHKTLLEYNAKPICPGFGVWTITHRRSTEVMGTLTLEWPQQPTWLQLDPASTTRPLGEEIGLRVSLGHRFWGHGYASEAGAALIRYAFATLGWTRMVDVVHADNTPGIRLLKRLGFRLEADLANPTLSVAVLTRASHAKALRALKKKHAADPAHPDDEIDDLADWQGSSAGLIQRLVEREIRLLAAYQPSAAQQAADALDQVPQASVPFVAAHLPLSSRVRIFSALGQRDPRPGVCALEPAWCVVPAGDYVIGSRAADRQARNNEPLERIPLAGVRVARYPVTNAQFGAFLADGGYAASAWWSPQGWDARQRDWTFSMNEMKWITTDIPWTQPGFWDNSQLNGANQPVVGISWYEADAFCRWLSARLGYPVFLPSEAQWAAAARGADGRIFPWGDAWELERASFRESELDAPPPVGCFPLGASPCGALDMAGGVWEWTASDYDCADRAQILADPDRTTYVTVHGGAWNEVPECLRSAGRYWHTPVNRNANLAFRLFSALA